MVYTYFHPLLLVSLTSLSYWNTLFFLPNTKHWAFAFTGYHFMNHIPGYPWLVGLQAFPGRRAWLAMHILGWLMTDVFSAACCLRRDGCFVSLAQLAFVSSQQWPDLTRMHGYTRWLGWIYNGPGQQQQPPNKTKHRTGIRHQKLQDNSLQDGMDTLWRMFDELITESPETRR